MTGYIALAAPAAAGVAALIWSLRRGPLSPHTGRRVRGGQEAAAWVAPLKRYPLPAAPATVPIAAAEVPFTQRLDPLPPPVVDASGPAFAHNAPTEAGVPLEPAPDAPTEVAPAPAVDTGELPVLELWARLAEKAGHRPAVCEMGHEGCTDAADCYRRIRDAAKGDAA